MIGLESAIGCYLCGRFGEFSVVLVTQMILPNCVWKAGKTAAAIRATAVSCLWALLKNKTMSIDQVIKIVIHIIVRIFLVC